MVDFHKCLFPHISTVVLVVVIENVILQYISTLDIIGLSHVSSLKTQENTSGFMLDYWGIQNGRKGNCITMSWETLIFFLSIEKRKRKKKSFEAYKSICMKMGQTLEDKTILFHVS